MPTCGWLSALSRSLARGRATAVGLLTAALISAALLPAQAQDTAVSATLYSFDATDGSLPGGLVQGSDGNFYGTTRDGGFGATAGTSFTGYGTVFRMTPAGELTTIYAFVGADDGRQPDSLSKGLDGNFYGLTRNGGANGANSGGTVFRIMPTGELTTLYASSGTFPGIVGPLVQDDSGNFYGVSQDGDADFGSIFRLTPAGEYTTLYTFPGGFGTRLGSGLTRGSDGNFYGTAMGGGDNVGTIYQITPAGALTTLYTFMGGADGALPNGLTLGPDGNLYGTTQTGNDYDGRPYGTVFRITNAGQFSILYNFTGGSDGRMPMNNLVLGGDGNFYGVTEATTVYPGVPSVFFRVTPQGVLTPLYASATTIGGEPDYSSGFIQGSDGNFYVSDPGGLDTQGSVFRLAVVSHPAFFTGQAPLTDGVDYLSFPNGNYFGYYAFLSDPDYLYHFDLGYEYLFDANDGQGGLYLYDFASRTFFYTSPTFPFPYLYDFSLNTVLYYYPDPNDAGHYNTDGVRYFYDFSTGKIISK